MASPAGTALSPGSSPESKMKKFDLHVALRVYPGISKNPFVFSNDKLRLFKLGLYSLKECLEDVRYKITVILDGCPSSYEEAVKNIFGEKAATTYLRKQGKADSFVGNAGTFNKQLEILLADHDSSAVMFAEDDYLYDSGLRLLVDLLKAQRADFVTPYDHPDYGCLWIHKKITAEEPFQGRSFIRVDSTCHTFLTTPEVLKETRLVFKTWFKGNWDAAMFWALTKGHVRSPVSLLQSISEAIRGNPVFLKVFLSAWMHSPGQILFGKKYKLVAPQPSVATHMESTALAPGIDWQKRATELIERYRV